jgi:hypothetical protein
MNRFRLNLAALALVVAIAPFAQAQDTAIEPGAIEALKQMGQYLRDLKSFRVEAVTSSEEVLDDGQKVSSDGTVTLLAKTGALREEVSNDRQERLYLYDGKNLTVYAKRVNYYATVPAPEKIGDLIDVLEDKYGIQMPLIDLFLWGTPHADLSDITGAMDLRPGVVGGTTCEHYLFRQKDIDWQLWIQKGNYPLPRKIVITTKTDDARPQYSAVYTWDLAPSYNDAAFVFDPPADAHRILLKAENSDSN